MRFSHAHLGITILSGLWLSACTEQIEPAIGEGVAPSFGLPAFFDCMDESGHTLISAHRGGPERGYPENSMAAFKRTTSHTHALLEVDVSTSADGVLFLHHDDTLDRTTTGSGLASETKWEKLKTLSLKDPDHRVTAYGLTRLDDT
ncbi:MAG: glycerophosphodiester phosphodiesterase family protein, partial [Pseudomonadota bacterium]